MSLLNKVPRVPWASKCSSARVSECLRTFRGLKSPSALSARVPQCLSAKVLKCLECPSVQKFPSSALSTLSAWVSFECPSTSSVQVSKCLEYLSAQVLFDCPSESSAFCVSVVWVTLVHFVSWESKCLSKSVSHSASQSDGL